MDSKKYIGMDVHKESISIAVRNGAGKIVMECVIETKASTILQFIEDFRLHRHVALARAARRVPYAVPHFQRGRFPGFCSEIAPLKVNSSGSRCVDPA
jgi:hypothetical protein